MRAFWRCCVGCVDRWGGGRTRLRRGVSPVKNSPLQLQHGGCETCPSSGGNNGAGSRTTRARGAARAGESASVSGNLEVFRYLPGESKFVQANKGASGSQRLGCSSGSGQVFWVFGLERRARRVWSGRSTLLVPNKVKREGNFSATWPLRCHAAPPETGEQVGAASTPGSAGPGGSAAVPRAGPLGSKRRCCCSRTTRTESVPPQ